MTMPNKRLTIFVFTLLAVSLACRQSVTPTAPPADSQPLENAGQTISGQLTSGGVTRTYLLHIPASAQSGQSAPLILNFHGLTSNAQEQESVSGMSAIADEYGWFVAYPNGLDEHWSTFPNQAGKADLQFVHDLIDALLAAYPIDPLRIYATGISNGGGMANRLACDLSDRIAAIAPVAGAYNAWENCNPARPVSVLAFHGLDDQIAPYEGIGRGNAEPPIREWVSAWAARNGCDSEPVTASQTPTMTIEQWDNCEANAAVILYTLGNHGHSWPGSSVMPAAITSQEADATRLMFEFFGQYTLP
ncbi:MAG TPA: hypothetical protein DCY14_06140 [Anaerolineae bacterium]|nr:hypothetical protein [Anaerolineae bacterium]